MSAQTDREAVERLAAERDEKAAESFMMAGLLRDADQDPTGFMLAGEYAAKTAAALYALLASNDALLDRAEKAEAERDAARAKALKEALRAAHMREVAADDADGPEWKLVARQMRLLKADIYNLLPPSALRALAERQP